MDCLRRGRRDGKACHLLAHGVGSAGTIVAVAVVGRSDGVCSNRERRSRQLRCSAAERNSANRCSVVVERNRPCSCRGGNRSGERYCLRADGWIQAGGKGG